MFATPARRAAALCALLIAAAVSVTAHGRVDSGDISVEFLDERDGVIDLYPLDNRRAVIRAEPGRFYAIRVSNKSDERVGLVIAVDGVNVISGETSRLAGNERMYLLGPGQTRVYRGWRTGSRRVNRFTFGEPDRRGDDGWSARPGPGVVGVAVFEERPLYRVGKNPQVQRGGDLRYQTPGPIAFAPRAEPLARYLVRYETGGQLCRRGVISCAPAERLTLRDLSVDVVDDRGRRFAQYPLDAPGSLYRAYLHAQRGENYAIRVSNYSDSRIGLVIAVDGRNVIDGSRSELSPGERMYVLDPGESADYEGWRTGRSTVNRFYFSDADDAYASAWGDRSMLGVIAVAAFQEKNKLGRDLDSLTSRVPSAEVGTGYGDEKRSPSRTVEFTPHPQAFGRYFIKYEDRDGLCRRQVIRCRGGDRDRGFAPPPPRSSNW